MRKTTLLILGLLPFTALLGAQVESPFGEIIDVRVVNLEAVVTDRRGDRVYGLKPEDFRLLVNGEEVPIEFFSEVSEDAPEPLEELSQAAGAAGGSDFSPQGRGILVFIDETMVMGAQRDLVLAGIEKDLDRLGPRDRMAVIAFDGRYVVQLTGWTGDRAAISRAFAAARRRPAWGARLLGARQEAMNGVEMKNMVGEEVSGMAPRLGIHAIGASIPPAIAHYTQVVPEAATIAMRSFPPPRARRVMLLLSGGWVMPTFAFPLVRAANQLGYTLYPVDVAGRDSLYVSNDAAFFSPTPLEQIGYVSTQWERDVHTGFEDAAAATGGKASLNGNRTAALERTLEDTASYYWLGFTPSWKDGSQSPSLRLEVRRPGLKVRTRSGF